MDLLRLEQQREEIDRQILAAKKEQRKQDLKTVRGLCKTHGFTANMLKGYLAEGRKRRSK